MVVTTGGKDTRTEGAVICVLIMILAFALPNGATMESSSFEGNEIDAPAGLDFVRSETAESNSLTIPEKPYVQKDDDGFPLADGPGETPMQSPYCVSETICLDIFAGHTFVPTDGGGDYVVGEGHEEYIGDQNGDGILERVVFYLYIPWMNDGIDNDGDGCVDEGTGWGCDNIADGMVIYETGWAPRLGGNDGTLLINLDWYSKDPSIEIYRISVSPRWNAHKVRGYMLYPSIAGEFISYYSYEGMNGVNANPEMDSDYLDSYVGSIDARGFPSRTPVDRACAAGRIAYQSNTIQRDDGSVVTTFYLYEFYDSSTDWNGDGDASDHVTAYYVLDENNGNCRQRMVNTGVSGYFATTSGNLITPLYTDEYGDNRDWNNNGGKSGARKLYHDVSTTEAMAGPAYTGYTFTAPVPSWGFGWWALYEDNLYRPYPGKSFIGFQVYVPSSQGYYHTYFVQTEDEDGDRHTGLPQYYIGYGYPLGVHGGECIQIVGRENYLEYAGVNLIGGKADGNGDGDTLDLLNYIFCPADTGGGGSYVIDPGSKYAKGLYQDPIPFLWSAYYVIQGNFEIDSLVTIPIILSFLGLDYDCDGDGQVDSICSSYFQYDLP